MIESIVQIALMICIAAICSVIGTGLWIRVLKKGSIGQPIRKEGNKEHYKKQGTPTMGGIAFTAIAVILSFIVNGFNYVNIIFAIGTVGFSAIGFIDDYEKVKKKENEGLTPKQKLVLQFAFAFVLVGIIYFNNPMVGMQEIPFFKWHWDLGVLWLPLLAFVVVGSVNATNLTDGLDGLVAGVTFPIFIAIAILASVSHSSDIVKIAGIFAGVLLGYLFYNANPASVMMGDVGSMALGGAVVTLLLLLNNLLYIIVLGGIYFIEALSVIIQVAYFKKTGGKRIFLMSPIHHHYELKGYKEQKVAVSFILVSFLLSCLTIWLILG